MDSIKDKTLSEIITEINQYLKILPNYKAGFFSNEAFSIFIHSDLKTYFTEFDSLFFCGYFTNAFAEILKKISEQYTRDMGNTRPYVALLSHGFRKDTRGKQNYQALKKIKKI